MSLSALTIAMAVATAPVPGGAAPVGKSAAKPAEVFPPVLPAQSTEPPQSTEFAPYTLAQSTDPLHRCNLNPGLRPPPQDRER